MRTLKFIKTAILLGSMAVCLLPLPVAAAENMHLQAGKADYKAENYEEAVVSLLKADKEEPSADSVLYLGFAYKEILNYQEAKICLKRAVSLDPSNGEAWLALGEVLYGLREYEEAERAAEKAGQLNARPVYASLLRGLISLNTKDYDRAISLFRQAGAENEYGQQGRYYLAIAYTESGRYEEAKKAFQEASAMNTESIISIYAGKGLEAVSAIRQTGPFRLSVGYSLQYDDNVILKPSEEISGVQISGEKDFRHVLYMKAEYAAKSLRASYSFFQSLHNELNRFNTQVHQIGLTPSYAVKNGKIELSASYDYFLVDNEKYLQVISLRPSYAHHIGDKKELIFFAGGMTKQYFKAPTMSDEERDGANINAGLSLFIHNNENNRYRYIDLSYTYDKENADGVNWKYTGHRGTIAVQHPSGPFDIRLSAQYYRQDYDNVHTTFGIKRSDDTFSIAPELSYSIKGAVMRLQYSNTTARSNIAIYDYHRNVYGLNVEYTF